MAKNIADKISKIIPGAYLLRGCFEEEGVMTGYSGVIAVSNESLEASGNLTDDYGESKIKGAVKDKLTFRKKYLHMGKVLPFEYRLQPRGSMIFIGEWGIVEEAFFVPTFEDEDDDYYPEKYEKRGLAIAELKGPYRDIREARLRNIYSEDTPDFERILVEESLKL